MLPADCTFYDASVISYCTAKLTGQEALPVVGFSGWSSVTSRNFCDRLDERAAEHDGAVFLRDELEQLPAVRQPFGTRPQRGACAGVDDERGIGGEHADSSAAGLGGQQAVCGVAV